jgi:hypothetical protein
LRNEAEGNTPNTNMESLKDLSIPTHQIKTTNTDNCFSVLAHRLWLKALSNGQCIDFVRRKDANDLSTGISWCQVHIKVRKSDKLIFCGQIPLITFRFQVFTKNPQKVIPLIRNRNAENDESTNLPLTYSQLMNFVSQTNHR